MNTWLTDREAFESLFRASPGGIAALDARGHFIACNPSFTRITGFGADSIAGKNVQELDGLAFRTFASGALAAAQDGGSLTRDIEFVRSDGEAVWCEVTSIPVGGSGDVRLFLAVQDITWRSEGSNAVAEMGHLRANFRLLFEHNPSVVLAIDLEQRITDVNPAGIRVSGFRRDQIVGQNVSSFVPPSQRDRLRVLLSQAYGGEAVTFPIDAYAADGRLIQYEATALPTIAQNRVIGVYGLLENVTERMRAERTVAAQREELIDLESDFRSLFDNNPDGIVLLSADGAILEVNEAAALMSVRPRETLIGQDFRTYLQGATLERAWNFFMRASDGETVRYELETHRGDGTDLVVDVTLFPKYAQGVVVAVYCLMQDITQRVAALRKWEQQAQRIRDLYLLATAPEHSDAQVIATLQTGCRLLAMEGGAIVDMTAEPRVDMRYDTIQRISEDDAHVIALAREVMDRKVPASASSAQQQDGEYGCWIGAPLHVAGAQQAVLLFYSRDRKHAFEEIDLDTIALMSALVGSALERRRTRSRLRTLAYFDSLTGLPNRAFFQERLRDSLLDVGGRTQPVAVMYFDLDRFKDINDTLGHAMGDRFLQMVARRLQTAVGDAGLVARMGGDEYAVLLPNCESVEHVHHLAQSLLAAIEEPYELDEYEQFVTTSIGVSLCPADGRDDQTLIKNADIAMYEVKDHGGNGYLFYNESLEAPIQTRLAQEKILRRAIEREQFTLHYQPIVDVVSERMVGVEALVRWNDPERGLVYPDRFIPAAESSGLIVKLGDWIFATAAAQLRDWHDRYGEFSLAVNISARQFHQPDLCRRLEELLENVKLQPHWVEIEITESMAISDIAHAIDTVHRFKQMGAHIGVDDFGTGHSSLNYLRRFEIDHVKIDRSFIAGIGVEHSDEAIVRTIIAMGRSLGLQIIAEGVETREQLEFLRAHGCDRAQGYLFSRPLDAATLEQRIPQMLGTAPGAG